MNIHKDYGLLFYFICFIKTFVQANNYQTLNISDYSKDVCFSVLKERHEGMVISTFVALRRHNIKKIMDSGYTIWDGSRSSKQLYLFKAFSLCNKYKLAFMYLHSDHISRTRYYQKRGYNWYEISLAEFGILFGRLEVERPLDLNDNFDNSVFMTQKHNFFGLPATVVIPRGKFIITTVTDDYEVIWTRTSSSHRCTSVIIHGHEKKPVLLHLHVKDLDTHTEHFYFKTDAWINTRKSYFYFRLAELDNEEINRRKLEELELDEIRKLEIASTVE